MIQRRDAVLAKVFFSGSNGSKIRPAIILSDKQYNEGNFVLIVSITTTNDEYCIPILEKDANCQLDKEIAARFDGIIKLSKKQIIKRIGKIRIEFYQTLINKITILIKQTN
ncbi:type II toxin-antitoxin system PemK/MazF family toxin [Candidatus Micrarchaeota archaeon]|nr:type II toxin-antitoxin system PemK/MazF family toxin [Candidatus Micrarchaeota archaeon]MBU1165712.1 type II toxin-antitoxin system PemK/MazF family toxin [Candidatus Micrarchaeota archaeon]MBU1887079.1 type II toxin-antitoxin system PemK/MazF family toxin [Candidatus Micrarchaeota archaeon]